MKPNAALATESAKPTKSFRGCTWHLAPSFAWQPLQRKRRDVFRGFRGEDEVSG